jgi:HNH endonuclease
MEETLQSDKMVWVEVSANQRIVRIFRSHHAAVHLVSKREAFYAVEMNRSEAVGAIRHNLFVRSGSDCEICGSPITESGGHMHEQKHRGRGGEISLENSLFICAKCHAGAHKERNPQWTK